MAILAGDESDPIALLNHVLERERDVLGAIHMAQSLDHVRRDRNQLGNFRSMHQKHLVDVSAAVRRLGGEPVTSGDAMSIVDRGKVILGAIGGARGVLAAMKSNVDALANVYVRAGSNARIEPDVRAIMERCAAETKWEGAWIEERLGLDPDVGENVMAPEGENERARTSSESIH